MHVLSEVSKNDGKEICDSGEDKTTQSRTLKSDIEFEFVGDEPLVFDKTETFCELLVDLSFFKISDDLVSINSVEDEDDEEYPTDELEDDDEDEEDVAALIDSVSLKNSFKIVDACLLTMLLNLLALGEIVEAAVWLDQAALFKARVVAVADVGLVKLSNEDLWDVWWLAK